MDQARVVEVWVPATGHVGSGYLLTERLVLTSYHVVQALAPGDRVEVRPFEVPQCTTWLAATVRWPHDAVDLDAAPEQDAALLVIDDPPGGVGPLVGAVHFGRVSGQDRVSCMGMGFPDAEARPDNRRDTMPVRGHVDALQARRSGMLTVHVDEGVVPRRSARGSGWAGSSGTALFCESLLVGVLTTDRALADDARVLGAVPVTALARLPGFRATLAAYGIDLQLEHTSPAARQLAAYLDAARDAATKHPYAGALPGTTPPLADVYLRQHVRPLHGKAADDRDAPGVPAVAMPAHDVLADPPTCVILSGPGGGKSSLLRTRLADAVERWQDGRDENLLPVLVPAAALAEATLPEALATAASDLDLVDALPATFFAGPPRPGARWLVLVDGLDEVTDPALRRKILGKVALAGSGQHAHLYRFVVATRPLPDGELGALGTGVPCYDLEPFDHDDLETVARGWFHAALLPDPADAARRFVETLERSRLAAPARTPLMAAMLCQLQAASPNKPLPANRGEVYEQYTALLYQHQYRSTAPGSHLSAALASYPDGAARAEYTLTHLPDLIEFLAARRHVGSALPTLTIVQSRAEAACPRGIPAGVWHRFLDTALRRSGLLIPQAGDLVFPHQTLLEYLSARHVKSIAGVDALQAVFDHPRRRRPFRPVRCADARWWFRKYWEPPPADPSDAGFLLDLAGDEHLAARTLHIGRLVEGGLAGWEYLAALARLGTALPDDVLRNASRAMKSAALDNTLDSWIHMRAVDALAGIGDSGSLCDAVRDENVHISARVAAAAALADLGDRSACDIIHALVPYAGFTSRSYESSKLRVVTALHELGDTRAAGIFHRLACDAAMEKLDVRVEAATALLDLGDTRGVALLREVAVGGGDDWWALRAAEGLARHGDSRGLALLKSMAVDWRRWKVAEILADLGDPDASDVWHALALDPGRPGDERLRAATALADHGDSRAPEVLHTISLDSSLRGHSVNENRHKSPRVRAAGELARLGDPRGRALLESVALDAQYDGWERLEAAEVRAGLGDLDAADTLHSAALDPTHTSQERLKAAEALAGLRDPRAADTLYTIGLDASMVTWKRSFTGYGRTHPPRLSAAELLVDLGDPRGIPLLRRLCRARGTFDWFDRQTASESLRELRDHQVDRIAWMRRLLARQDAHPRP